MKSFLVKIGKITAAIKREGFLSAARSTVSALFIMMRPVGAGDIVFITSGAVGDSTRYRAWNVAEELDAHGFKCSVVPQYSSWLRNCADKFHIFIFHKVFFTPKISALIEEIKKQNKTIIFETDDLTFDPKYFKNISHLEKISALEKKIFENGLGSEILNDPYVKVCTATTTYLADILMKYGKEVFVVPNKLSDEDLEIADNLVKRFNLPARRASLIEAGGSRPKQTKEVEPQVQAVRIGYFSGTRSHDRDFATVVKPLAEIMEKHPKTILCLAGPLDIGKDFDKFPGRVIRLPFAARNKHFKNIASVDINIAPLEVGNPFCEAKSELKFFEAGILGVPTVAAATRTFREAIEDGVDGFIAGTAEDWKDKIEKLLMDEELRKKMGEKARGKAMASYANKNSRNEKYYDFLRNRIKEIK